MASISIQANFDGLDNKDLDSFESKIEKLLMRADLPGTFVDVVETDREEDEDDENGDE